MGRRSRLYLQDDPEFERSHVFMRRLDVALAIRQCIVIRTLSFGWLTTGLAHMVPLVSMWERYLNYRLCSQTGVMGESRIAIFAALAGNLAIAVVKFFAAAVTGSSAMLSEAIHSLVDTGNEGFLLLGIHKSQKPPDFEHPYGHGREIYFWSFVVAIAIFALGGGVSIYEGVRSVLSPAQVEDPFWNYVVLASAFLFESTSWYFGWRAFRRDLHHRGPLQAIRRSKDPTSFIVVLEDTAALLGLLIAFLGVFIGQLTKNPFLDGTASILIGVMLAAMSAFLAYETKGLLIGEGYDKETLHNLREIIESDESIKHVSRLLTLFFAPEDVMLTAEVRFSDNWTMLKIRAAMTNIKEKIRAQYPEIKRIYFTTERLTPDGSDELQPHGSDTLITDQTYDQIVGA